MDELMYDTLIRYFKTLAHTGYKSYDLVFKMLVMDFIYEITHTELRYYITNKDIKLMQDLLYQFFGSTCEISFPTNNRSCCVCVCCNGEGSTPPPIVVPTTTTTTTTPPPPPIISSTTTTTSTPTPGITTTTSTTTTSTPAPSNKKGTLLFKAVAGWPYIVYYNRDLMTSVNESDVSSTIPIPSSTTSVYYSIERIVWNSFSENNEAGGVSVDGVVKSIPYIGELQPDSTVTIEPVVSLTSTTTTSTPAPVASNDEATTV